MAINLSGLATEQRNQNTLNIDEVQTLQMVTLINNEDKTVPFAVEKELPQIAATIDIIYDKMEKGGRLFYCGAGTSGRLGILDASECPPTYGVDDNQVIALIAGGEKAILKAVENAEDNEMLCVEELKSYNFSSDDVLVGIAASGRTPYVIGGMNYAKLIGAKVISLTCNNNCEMTNIADIAIAPVVGGEAVTGSTRMKAGTAQKLVLNMISTGVMIKLGKVYSNLMVDVQSTNLKLIERAKRIVMQATDCSYEKAESTLSETEFNPKTAILMILSGLSAQDAKALLIKNNGHIKSALK